MAKNKMKLAPHIWKEPDGRLLLWVRVRPNLSKQGHLDKCVPLSEAMQIVEKWKKALIESKNPSDVSSLKIETIADAMNLHKITPKPNGEVRAWIQDDWRFSKIIEEIGHIKLSHSWDALKYMTSKMKEDGYAHGTINRVIAMLKGAVSTAYNERVNDGNGNRHLLPENYLTKFPTLVENNISFRSLSPEERTRLWGELPQHLKPLFYFACTTPARITELLSITKDQVNFQNRTITIPMGRKKDGSNKTGIGRTLVIPSEMFEYFEMVRQSPAKYLFNRGPEFSYQRIAYTTKGKEGDETFFGRQDNNEWENALRRSGISGYTFHKTRQEAILNLYAMGWDLEEIRFLGGWTTMTAFDRYVDRNMCLYIKNKSYDIDLSWMKTFAKDLIFTATAPEGMVSKIA